MFYIQERGGEVERDGEGCGSVGTHVWDIRTFIYIEADELVRHNHLHIFFDSI